MKSIFSHGADKKNATVSPAAMAWKASLLVFGLLILVIQINFYFQTRQAEKMFADNVREHAGLLGEVIRLNAEGAVLSRDVVREIMQTFLTNAAHFIDYLDAVKPFAPDELTALSRQLGLDGIRLSGPDYTLREGPAGWIGNETPADMPDSQVWQLPGENMFLFRYPRFERGMVLTGMVSDRFNELEDKISLDELFRRITGLAGIRYVRLEDHDGSAEGDFRNVRILESSSGRVAETRLRLKNRALVIGMGCELYDGRMAENRRQWMLFSIIVLGAGILCSYLLYGFQKSHLEMVRKMDQRLAREREDAALGRATAAITHEIRNPLNAISMGLQRLSIEAESLDEDHRGLIRDLLESVGRTDRIITDLKRFTGPLSLNVSVFSLGKIVETAASPYRGRIRDMGIVLTLPDPSFRDRVQADRDYCQILVGNLVKNAVEALAEDTDIKNRFISIDLEQSESSLTLVIRNSGFTGDPVHPEKILEPYVTTKTRGTGVGLAIVKRITEAHGGEIRLAVPEEGILEIRVDLPKAT